MTEEQFIRKKFSAFMPMVYYHPGMEVYISAMLAGVDFDERIFCLRPYPDSEYEKCDFYVRCEHVEIETKQKYILKKIK